MEPLPIACTLSPSALKARKEGLLLDLVGRAAKRMELPNGYRLQFGPSGAMLLAIIRTVDAERQCCRFLRFTLTVEAEEGPLTLDLTGPAGTREFLSALLES